jgi:chromosome partitioning protein
VKRRCERARSQSLRDKESPTRGLWTNDPSGLAADYQELVRQIVARLVRYESAAAPIAEPVG